MNSTECRMSGSYKQMYMFSSNVDVCGSNKFTLKFHKIRCGLWGLYLFGKVKSFVSLQNAWTPSLKHSCVFLRRIMATHFLWKLSRTWSVSYKYIHRYFPRCHGRIPWDRVEQAKNTLFRTIATEETDRTQLGVQQGQWGLKSMDRVRGLIFGKSLGGTG